MSVKETSSIDHKPHKRSVFLTKTCRLLSMLTLISIYLVVELVVGKITNSVTLVADAFHMLSDVLSMVIAILAVRISKQPSNRNTYGWARAEVVGANTNTVFLLALCLTILFDAIKRFIQPEPIENVNLLLIVGSIGLGINIIGLFLFQGFHGHSHSCSSHGHSHSHSHVKQLEHNHTHNQIHRDVTENTLVGFDEISNKCERHSTCIIEEVFAECAHGNDEQSEILIDTDEDKKAKQSGKSEKSQKKRSMNMHGVFLHVLADALGSVVVIISALLIKFFPHDPENKNHWTMYIDPTLSVIIVVIITISTIPLFKETSYILLQAIPKNLQIHGIKSRLLESIPEIHSVHELHVWRLTDDKVIASAHLNRKNLSNYMAVADKVKKFFHSIGIHSVTIQYEFDEDDTRSDEESTTSTSNEGNGTSLNKIPDDCLLRCENVECETQTCCRKTSDRNNISRRDIP